MSDEEVLTKIKEEYSDDRKMALYEKLASEDAKIEVIQYIQNSHKISRIMEDLSSDEKRMEAMQYIPDSKVTLELIWSFSKDDTKVELMEKYISNPDDKTKMIAYGIKSDKTKLELMNKHLTSEDAKLEVILSLSSDDKRMETIDLLEPDEDLKKKVAMLFVDKENTKKYMDIPMGYTSIGLPKDMTIGMEVECEGENSKWIDKLGVFLVRNNSDYPEGKDSWKAEYDGSLDMGVEIVSPILKDNPNDVEDIYVICSKLKQLGQGVSDNCGGHVHIGANYLTTKESFANLYEIWGNTEEVLFKICNEQGDLPREGFQFYAATVGPKLNRAMGEDSVNLEKEEDITGFIENLKTAQGNRYSAVNLMNVNNKKNTIEFRVSNGTVNPDTWVENIRLYGRIMELAEKTAQIEKKEELTKEEKRTIDLKERLKTEMPENEKLEVLLEMLFSEEEREVYRGRYNKVEELLQENPENKELFTQNNVVIDFKKKKKQKDEFKAITQERRTGEIEEVRQDITQEVQRGKETQQQVNDREDLE